MSGRVKAIGIATAAGEPLRGIETVRAIAGAGLEGDRYAEEAGEFSDETSGMRDITLIAAEALERLHETGVELTHLESRRNVLTSGIDLNALVGKRFTVGAVECIGRELAEPCDYLQSLTRPDVLRGLVHDGGLRAGILTDGVIATGDPVAGVDV